MHVLLYTGNSSASRTYVTAARALCSALRFGRMNLRGRFGLSCRTSSRVNLLRRRPVLHSNAESAGRHSLGIFSFISLLIEWHGGESNPAASGWVELAKTLAGSFRAGSARRLTTWRGILHNNLISRGRGRNRTA